MDWESGCRDVERRVRQPGATHLIGILSQGTASDPLVFELRVRSDSERLVVFDVARRTGWGTAFA